MPTMVAMFVRWAIADCPASDFVPAGHHNTERFLEWTNRYSKNLRNGDMTSKMPNANTHQVCTPLNLCSFLTL